MERLTEKIVQPYSIDLYDAKFNLYEPKNYSSDTEIGACIDKLGQLEDIEEQLDCPITVREKAFENGFYDENGEHYICEHYVPYLKSMHTRGIMTHTEKRFKLKDYQKSWWLKQDKSE